MKNLLLVLALGLLASCASLDPAKRYADKNSMYSYESVMKESETFTIKSLKEDRSDLKKEIRQGKKEKGDNSKKSKIKEDLEKLRDKAEENK